MADDITLKTVLDHIHAMQSRMDSRFEDIERRFDKVDQKFEIVDRRFDELEQTIQMVETNLSRQIDAIDHRLDEIEIEGLPSRIKKLEMAR